MQDIFLPRGSSKSATNEAKESPIMIFFVFLTGWLSPVDITATQDLRMDPEQ